MNKLKNSEENSGCDVFTTYDLGLAGALLASGFKLKCLDRSNQRRALFIFEFKSGIDVSANRFFTDQLRVKARSYFDCLKALKNQLYTE